MLISCGKRIIMFYFQNKAAATGAQPEIFQGRKRFVELGHFDKNFVKNTRKKGPTGKSLEFFLLNTL